MSVEVVESGAALTMDIGSDSKMPVEKVNITFGSHNGEEKPAIAETNKVSESNNLPKDAVDDWPEPKQIHSFYVVRFRPIEDQNLKAKLDLAEKELQKKNQARVQLIEKLKSKRADRSQVVAQIRSLSVENRQFRTIMDEKRKEMEPLHQALGKLRGGNAGGGRERSLAICSSEEELNGVIKSLQYRIQHESIPLNEEKQILREIKQLEGTRAQVIANAAERAKIQESLGEKDAIQDQVKLIGVGLDGARKEKQVINAKLKQLDEEKLVIEKALGALEEELNALTEKRDKTYESIKEMRKQREDGNTPFYENRNLLTKAKVLAANKDVESLKELVDTEVKKFMSLWNSNKAFRDDYERRILPSLDMRQLSRDGRLRNPGEKPLVQPIIQTPSQPEVVKISSKQPAKENTVISPAQADSAVASEEKPQKAKNNAKNNKEGNKKTEINKKDIDDEEEFFVSSKLENNSVSQIDEKKLKEMKKEEEIAKRIQAEERKKKQAEKAAAKAAIKAQKEAEKKLKEREKRARKKSGVAETEEPTEEVTEVAEEEKIEETVETPVPTKNKERKESIARNRPRARGGADSLPKAILKRKKATNYYNWMYIAPAAVAITLVLVAVGYSYLI